MKEKPARGDNRDPLPNRKVFSFRGFLILEPRQLASICVNEHRTCGNCGTKLTQVIAALFTAPVGRLA